MQKQLTVLSYILFFSLIGWISNPSIASGLNDADSLFEQKKYTQAFGIYDSLFREEGLESPQILMKMAFIKEGLNDYTNAIYYLNQYYKLTYDKKTLIKISDLAEAHHLKGYKYNDVRFFESLQKQYKSEIMWSIFALIALVFGLAMIKYKRKKQFSFNSLITIIILILLAFAAVFFPDFQKKGILIDNSLIYKLPSSGSEVLETAEKGRQIEILDEIDVWSVITYGEEHAYVKTTYIREL